LVASRLWFSRSRSGRINPRGECADANVESEGSMKAEIAKLWAEALPHYKQTKFRLRRGDSFDPLGVLCNLHAQAHPEIAATQPYPGHYLDQGFALPAAVKQWAGMRSNIGQLRDGRSLSGENDNGASFETIAKLIKQHAEDL
jgi:hypothetical protein